MWDGARNGDVRAVASTLRDGIGDATEAGRNGLTDLTNWSSGKVGEAADYARSHITGDDLLSRSARGLITGGEEITRFQIGAAGGLLREATGMVGGIGQLAVTAGEIQASPEAAREYGGAIVSALGRAGSATGDYLSSVTNNPSRLGGDLSRAWNAASGWAGGKLDSYGQAIREGRTETIGMDAGTVASYLIPVGGGARALGLAGRGTAAAAETTGRVLAETGGREAVDALAGGGARLRPAIAEHLTPARPELTPDFIHASAQRADMVYGRPGGAIPAGDRMLSAGSGNGWMTQAARQELHDLTGLSPEHLNGVNGAFKADVFVTGPREAPTGVHIAFRGTRPTSLRDWASNVGQGLRGTDSAHYRMALEIGKIVGRSSDPSLLVTFTGHSLGGGLASHAAKAAGRQSITFNAAGLHALTIERSAAAAAQNGLATGIAANRFVPGEVLTSLQDRFSFMPRALGAAEALPLVAPAGKEIASTLNPVHWIDRHSMNWVMAGTRSLLGG